MYGFLLLVIGGLAAYFWLRLQRAETRLDDLLDMQERTLDYVRGLQSAERSDAKPAAEAISEPKTVEPVAATVPSVSLRRNDETVSGEVQPAAPVASDLPTPVTEELPDEQPGPRFKIDLEDVFGRRLPIWAGGLTLAIAGVFLVRYSIELGLLTPIVRVALAFLFGLILLGAAEFAYRQEERIADPRVRQALAGAGLATLYAGFYLAGTQYGLVGQVAAFIGLAVVTAAAIALSYRFGLPSAILGLVGGFAAPALVGGEEANIPLLALYLGLVTSGLAFTGKRQERPWLGLAALAGGLGWGALLLLAGDFGTAEVLALGAYFIVLGAVLPALAGGEAIRRIVRLVSALVASIQLAFLVGQGGYSPLAWGLYLLLGATLAFLAWRRADLREANAAAAFVGLALYATWTGGDPMLFALVGAGLAAIFAVVPLVHLWRDEAALVDRFQIALVPPILLAVGYARFGFFDFGAFQPALALAAIALAAIPAIAATVTLRRSEMQRHAGMSGSAAALVLSGVLLITPGWFAPLAAALVLAVPVVVASRHSHAALRDVVWAGTLVAAFLLLATPQAWDELARLAGEQEPVAALRPILRWAALASPLAMLAWLESRDAQRRLAEALTVIVIYGALAQVLPWQALTWTAAGLGIALYYWQPQRHAAQASALGIAFLWVLSPVLVWAAAALVSLSGNPVFVGDVPDVQDALLHLLPFAAIAFVVGLPLIRTKADPVRTGWLAIPVLVVVAHILFKQLFAIETVTRFVALGMAERTLWQALLAALGWSSWVATSRFAQGKTVAKLLAAGALTHFLLYTGLLHNPLWDEQAVGHVPIANLILAAYALAMGAAYFLRVRLQQRFAVLFDALLMGLICVAALSLLRQVFAGSILTDVPMTQTEDLLRSLTGILLALLFLLIGSRFAQRSWRIGSLVVMLIAVAKVFMIDAAGLEGLLRIASFFALGCSLIGIGWVYSRQLRGENPPEKA